MTYEVMPSLEKLLESFTDEQRETFNKATKVMDIFENAVVGDVKKYTPFVRVGRLGISL